MKATNTYTDKELFARIAVGNEAAFEQIFQTYTKQLFPFIMSLVRSEQDTLEILQEVFLRLWTQRATLPDVHNPGAWIRTLASFVSYDYLRKEVRHQYVVAQLDNDLGVAADGVWDQLHLKELKAFLQEAVNQLPERRRQIFTMSKLEGRTRREIAAILNISENTVRNQLSDAIVFLQKQLQKHRNIHLPVLLLCFLVG